MSPLGILGGTFDPIHYGHLRLADEAVDALGLDGVLWLPAGVTPHRDAPRATAADRLAMVHLAVAGRSDFAVDASEAESAAPSYTVPSLERLRRTHGAKRPLLLLLGADAFLGLDTWHRWVEIFGLAHVAVATRPGHRLDVAAMKPPLAEQFRARQVDSAGELARRPAGAIASFAITALDISATAIRGHLAAGRSARYLLPDAVLDYIGRNQLYSSA
jgi:nicotinate-nucleotide adenylyltransferase